MTDAVFNSGLIDFAIRLPLSAVSKAVLALLIHCGRLLRESWFLTAAVEHEVKHHLNRQDWQNAFGHGQKFCNAILDRRGALQLSIQVAVPWLKSNCFSVCPGKIGPFISPQNRSLHDFPPLWEMISEQQGIVSILR